MRGKKLFVSAVLISWLLLLAFLAGPVRWEFAYSYDYWVKMLGGVVPTPTLVLGLPLLGLGEMGPTAILVASICWGIAWLGPLALLAGVWRASSREALLEWLVLGGGLYGLLMLAITLLTLFSLWLPFGLMC